MKVQYCQLCERMVKPTKHVNWLIFIIAAIFTSGLWLLIYPIYYFFFKGYSCPICGSNALLDAAEKKALEKLNENAKK